MMAYPRYMYRYQQPRPQARERGRHYLAQERGHPPQYPFLSRSCGSKSYVDSDFPSRDHALMKRNESETDDENNCDSLLDYDDEAGDLYDQEFQWDGLPYQPPSQDRTQSTCGRQKNNDYESVSVSPEYDEVDVYEEEFPWDGLPYQPPSHNSGTRRTQCSSNRHACNTNSTSSNSIYAQEVVACKKYNCPLCSAASRPHQHHIGDCPFLPLEDKRCVAQARHVSNIFGYDEFLVTDLHETDCDLSDSLSVNGTPGSISGSYSPLSGAHVHRLSTIGWADDSSEVDESPECVGDVHGSIGNSSELDGFHRVNTVPLSSTVASAPVVPNQANQSPYVDFFSGNQNIRVSFISGATVNLIRYSTVCRLGSSITVAHQPSDSSLPGIVGETSLVFTLANHQYLFVGYVVESLSVEVQAGIPFMERHDVTVRPAQRQIRFGDGPSFIYGSPLRDHSPVTRPICETPLLNMRAVSAVNHTSTVIAGTPPLVPRPHERESKQPTNPLGSICSPGSKSVHMSDFLPNLQPLKDVILSPTSEPAVTFTPKQETAVSSEVSSTKPGTPSTNPLTPFQSDDLRQSACPDTTQPDPSCTDTDTVSFPERGAPAISEPVIGQPCGHQLQSDGQRTCRSDVAPPVVDPVPSAIRVLLHNFLVPVPSSQSTSLLRTNRVPHLSIIVVSGPAMSLASAPLSRRLTLLLLSPIEPLTPSTREPSLPLVVHQTFVYRHVLMTSCTLYIVSYGTPTV